MKYRVLLLVFSLAVTTATAFAQRSSDNSATLSGTVLSTTGHPMHDVRVEVHNLISGSLIASGYTLPGGGFSFNNVPSGHYEVRVVNGLQEARERVDIEHLDAQITLRISDAADATSGTAIVSVAEMRVPDKAKKEFAKSQEAFAKHKLDEARAHCAKSLAVAPNYSRALTMSALLDLTENKLEDAASKGEQAIKSDYGYGIGYVVLGAVYNAMGRFDDAIRTLDRAMPLAASSWQAYYEMSKAQLGKGDFQRALDNVDRASQLTPAAYAPIHLVRAHALLGLKSYQNAMVELEKYIGDDPEGANRDDARKTLDQVKAFVATAKK